jgi:hypothetical protein
VRRPRRSHARECDTFLSDKPSLTHPRLTVLPYSSTRRPTPDYPSRLGSHRAFPTRQHGPRLYRITADLSDYPFRYMPDPTDQPSQLTSTPISPLPTTLVPARHLTTVRPDHPPLPRPACIFPLHSRRALPSLPHPDLPSHLSPSAPHLLTTPANSCPHVSAQPIRLPHSSLLSACQPPPALPRLAPPCLNIRCPPRLPGPMPPRPSLLDSNRLPGPGRSCPTRSPTARLHPDVPRLSPSSLPCPLRQSHPCHISSNPTDSTDFPIPTPPHHLTPSCSSPLLSD